MRFRAWRRGFKEMDLILGNFTDRYVDIMDEPSRTDLEVILDIPDHDFYAWLNDKQELPGGVNIDLANKIKVV